MSYARYEGLAPISVLVRNELCALRRPGPDFCSLHSASDIRSPERKKYAALIHAGAHLVVILLGTLVVTMLLALSRVQSIPVLGDSLYFLGLGGGMILCGYFGGMIWGRYLTIVSRNWGDEGNNAFSALGLDSYKNFIRLKISNNILTVFPIGLDEVPPRSGWQINPAFDEKNIDQNVPYIVPKGSLGQRLIEEPIVINLDEIAPVRAIA